MKIIVFSSPTHVPNEISIIIELFNLGLTHFHLRKPKFSRKKTIEFIESIPSKYHKNIILHSYHGLALKYNLKGIHLTKRHKKKKLKNWFRLKYLKSKKPNLSVSCSFHSIESLSKAPGYDYVFISPVFNSISKTGYTGAFEFSSLRHELKNNSGNIVALGGIETKHLEKLKNTGFFAAALLGSLWFQGKNPVEEFKNGTILLNKKSSNNRVVVSSAKYIPVNH